MTEGSKQFDARYSGALLPSAAAKLAAIRRTRGQAGAKPTEPWALGGTVLTPDELIDKGWVLIDGTQIVEVTTTKPQSVPTLATGGVILPGLIDLHGHPEWNVFPAWEPPHLYPNRYAWRSSAAFQELVGGPMSNITDGFSDKQFLALLARYAEIRALIGGTTTVQGSSSDYPTAPQAIVRHVDLSPFGDANAASMVDPLKPEKLAERDLIRAGIKDGTITAFYAHLAEGVDRDSSAELDALSAEELLTSATVVIHGTALTADQLVLVREAGAKLIWSPQSNLRLYGATTLAGKALQLGIPLSIGADWLPSGSVSLLAEIQVARRLLAAQGERVDARSLVEMVTSGAARIANLPRHLGRLQPGRPADVLVLERRHHDPYEDVCQARRSSVELVLIDGHLLYGRDDWFQKLASDATGERLSAWGKPMRLAVAAPASPDGHHPPLPGLATIRAELLERWPRAGPIFA